MSVDQLLSRLDDSNFTSCGICLEHYSISNGANESKVPKTLSCLHTFCRCCLSKSFPVGSKEAQCFVCNTLSPLDVTLGVDSLKTNFMIQSLVDVVHGGSTNQQQQQQCGHPPQPPPPQNATTSTTSTTTTTTTTKSGGSPSSSSSLSEGSSSSNSSIGSRVCESCPEDEASPATLVCSDCSDELFCVKCFEAHIKTKKGRNHISCALSVDKFKNISRKCTVHSKESVKYVCETCSTSQLIYFCQICLVDNIHQSHKVSSIQKHAQMKSADLATYFQTAKDLLDGEKDVLKLIDQNIELQKESMKTAKFQINTFIDSVVEMAENCRKSWIVEVEQQGPIILTALSSDKKSVEIQIGNADMFIERAKACQQSQTDFDMCESSVKIRELLDEAVKVLVAPYSISEVTSLQTDQSDLFFSVSEVLKTNPFQMVVKQRRVSERKLFSSADNIHRFHSTFSEAVVVNRQSPSTITGVGGVLGANSMSMCIFNPVPPHQSLTTSTSSTQQLGGSGDSSSFPKLFVADFSMGRIQVFNALSGAYSRTIGSLGSGASNINNPVGCALGCIRSGSNGTRGGGGGEGGGGEGGGGTSRFTKFGLLEDSDPFLFVVDQSNNRVQVFNSATGVHVRSFGSAGSGQGQFSLPFGCCFESSEDAGDLLYVADQSNNRVQVFNAADGTFVRSIGQGSGQGAGYLHHPTGVVIVPNPSKGTGANTQTPSPPLLYVAEYSNHRVQVFNARTGEHVRFIGSQGAGAGQFQHPRGLCYLPGRDGVDGALLYVAEYGNKRVQSLDPLTGVSKRTYPLQAHPHFVVCARNNEGVPFMYIGGTGNSIEVLSTI